MKQAKEIEDNRPSKLRKISYEKERRSNLTESINKINSILPDHLKATNKIRVLENTLDYIKSLNRHSEYLWSQNHLLEVENELLMILYRQKESNRPIQKQHTDNTSTDKNDNMNNNDNNNNDNNDNIQSGQ